MLQHKTKIAIVDDHPIVIEGLRKLLADYHSIIELSESFTNGSDFISFLKNTTIDLVLLDITLPDINGMDLCKEIKKISPGTFVLAFSNYNERSMVIKMLQNGACGYLLKNASAKELIDCIIEAINGQITFSLAVKEIMSKPESQSLREVAQLTTREKQILKLISDGKTTPELAQQLFLSKLTVETHRKNLLSKFKAKNVAELIRIAAQEGFL